MSADIFEQEVSALHSDGDCLPTHMLLPIARILHHSIPLCTVYTILLSLFDTLLWHLYSRCAIYMGAHGRLHVDRIRVQRSLANIVQDYEVYIDFWDRA
jgi:hypothetical protein